ncbi:MAG: hypothetical protein AB1489_38865 [Acidobacteriota bacterium]
MLVSFSPILFLKLYSTKISDQRSHGDDPTQKYFDRIANKQSHLVWLNLLKQVEEGLFDAAASLDPDLPDVVDGNDVQQRSIPAISATSPALPTFAHYFNKPIVEDSPMHSDADSDSSDTPAATMDADSNATDEQQQAIVEHVLPAAPIDAQLWADVPVEHFSDSNMCDE